MPPENQRQQNKSAPQTIRTYQSDVEEMLKSGEGSLAKIAIAENAKRVRGDFALEEPENPERTKWVVGVSLSLIVLGLGAFASLYFFGKKEQQPVPVIPQTQTIIATDLDKDLNIKGLGRDEIIAALGKEQKENTAALSSVVGLRLIEGRGDDVKTIDTENFLQKIGSHPPTGLVRSLSDNFLLGLHALNINQPFLIFKTGYYQNAFAGMLAWENNLKDDLGPIFIPPEPIVVATTSDQVIKRRVVFEDIVVKNRDTRALRDADGKIIFLYSFPDKNTVVITTNADTLQKISERLLAGKLVQ